jgi:hypothetical protein
LRESQGDESAVTPTSLLEVLADVLSDLQAVRSNARVAGNTTAVVRASVATATVVNMLFEKLGGEGDLAVVQALRESDLLVKALGQAVRRDPAIGHAVAGRLRQLGDRDIADALAALAERTASNQETKSKELTP